MVEAVSSEAGGAAGEVDPVIGVASEHAVRDVDSLVVLPVVGDVSKNQTLRIQS